MIRWPAIPGFRLDVFTDLGQRIDGFIGIAEALVQILIVIDVEDPNGVGLGTPIDDGGLVVAADGIPASQSGELGDHRQDLALLFPIFPSQIVLAVLVLVASLDPGHLVVVDDHGLHQVTGDHGAALGRDVRQHRHHQTTGTH